MSEKGHLFESKHVDISKVISPLFIPDTIIDGWGNDFLTLRGASIRGVSHRWDKSPRQDSFATAYIPEKNWVVVAVADGVSGAAQSHIGATVAVNSAIKYFADIEVSEIEQINWKNACETIAWDLNLKMQSLKDSSKLLGEIGETRKDIAIAALKFLATTLVCAVITKNEDDEGLTAWLMTIGDSGVWVLSSGEYRAVAGGKDEDSDILKNDVAPLPFVPDIVEPIQIPLNQGEILLLGTDGFGEPLGSGNGDLGLLFKNIFKTIPSLAELANALDFKRKYFVDDRTLVAIWPKGNGVEVKGVEEKTPANTADPDEHHNYNRQIKPMTSTLPSQAPQQTSSQSVPYTNKATAPSKRKMKMRGTYVAILALVMTCAAFSIFSIHLVREKEVAIETIKAEEANKFEIVESEVANTNKMLQEETDARSAAEMKASEATKRLDEAEYEREEAEKALAENIANEKIMKLNYIKNRLIESGDYSNVDYQDNGTEVVFQLYLQNEIGESENSNIREYNVEEWMTETDNIWAKDSFDLLETKVIIQVHGYNSIISEENVVYQE